MKAMFICFVGFVNCYDDIVPDPDLFIPPSSNTDHINLADDSRFEVEKFAHCRSNDKAKLPGYFKYIIREVLKKDVLSDEETDFFSNPESVDPQTLSDIIVGLISLDSPKSKQKTMSIYPSFAFVANLPDYLIYQIVFIYIVTMFVLCFFSQQCRYFIIAFHILVIYLGAVYCKMNRQYSDIKGGKMAAISTMPSHCKANFSIQNMFSLAWSKFQIGDQCKKYNQQVLSDPLYEIEYHKAFVYPLISMLSVPLNVLGEEMGSFLENILTPFPFYLQVIILVFIASIFIGVTYLLCSSNLYTRSCTFDDKKKDIIPKLIFDNLLKEIQELRNEMKISNELTRMDATDIVVLNNDTRSSEIDGNMSITDQ